MTTSRWTTGRHDAAVLIRRNQAIVAEQLPDGEVLVGTVPAGRTADRLPYLARVAHRIGQPDSLFILGSEPLRTELEREWVSITHLPERIVDVHTPLRVTAGDLVDRLRALAA
jgi:hypothetical protein